MAASQIKNVAISMADKYDRNNFIQNVLLGNLLSVDLQSKARKLIICSAFNFCFSSFYISNSGDLLNFINFIDSLVI